MKKKITTFLFFLFFTFNISAETIYLTCDGSADGEFKPAFRWIQLDKEQETILFTGTWVNVEIDEKTYEQKWFDASGYSEDLTSIKFVFKNTKFYIHREYLTLTQISEEGYGFSPIEFKCNLNDSFNVQNEHRINYWKALIKKNKI